MYLLKSSHPVVSKAIILEVKVFSIIRAWALQEPTASSKNLASYASWRKSAHQCVHFMPSISQGSGNSWLSSSVFFTQSQLSLHSLLQHYYFLLVILLHELQHADTVEWFTDGDSDTLLRENDFASECLSRLLRAGKDFSRSQSALYGTYILLLVWIASEHAFTCQLHWDVFECHKLLHLEAKCWKNPYYYHYAVSNNINS